MAHPAEEGSRRKWEVIDENVLKWTALLLSILSSGVLIISMHETSDWILGLALLVGVALALAEFDLFHPYTWYVPFFFLYSASVPILVWLEIKEDIGDLQETVFLEWLALTVFLLVVGPVGRKLMLPSQQLPRMKVMAWVLLTLSMAVSAAYLGHIWQNNLASKYEIALSPSVLARLDPAFSVYALVYTMLLCIAFQHKVFPWGLIVCALGWNVLAFLLSGERDLVFRILWITVFLFHGLYRPLSRGVLAGIAVAFITLVPILGDLKNVLLSETEPTVILNALALRVLNDEFLTGSENLQFYLRNAGFEPFYFGETLLWDLKRAFLPGFIFPEGPDPQRYFNMTFFPEIVEQGGGRGFTLVGEGYMNFGALGVVLWFVFLGLFVRYLYERGTRSVTWFAVYVVSMPLIIYVIRADFSNLIAQYTKHIIIPMLLLHVGQRILCGALEYRQSCKAPVS